MNTQQELEKRIIQQAGDMLLTISTDWKMDVANNELLATDPADNEQGVIATFNGPNHMDIAFALHAPITIKTLLDLNKRAIAKVKQLQSQIAALNGTMPLNKDYCLQIVMMYRDQNFIEFLINRYSLDEKPTTKKAITACDKALKNDIGVATKTDIKWRKTWVDHWLNINREYQQSDFAKQETAT